MNTTSPGHALFTTCGVAETDEQGCASYDDAMLLLVNALLAYCPGARTGPEREVDEV